MKIAFIGLLVSCALVGTSVMADEISSDATTQSSLRERGIVQVDSTAEGGVTFIPTDTGTYDFKYGNSWYTTYAGSLYRTAVLMYVNREVDFGTCPEPTADCEICPINPNCYVGSWEDSESRIKAFIAGKSIDNCLAMQLSEADTVNMVVADCAGHFSDNTGLVTVSYRFNPAADMGTAEDMQVAPEREKKPELIITRMGLQEGTRIPEDSVVHPFCQVHNIGGVESGDFRLAYYIDWDEYRDDDGVDSLCPQRCYSYEHVQNDDIRLGDTGTRTLRCCVDYLEEVTEWKEDNNCRTMSFTVY